MIFVYSFIKYKYLPDASEYGIGASIFQVGDKNTKIENYLTNKFSINGNNVSHNKKQHNKYHTKRIQNIKNIFYNLLGIKIENESQLYKFINKF